MRHPHTGKRFPMVQPSVQTHGPFFGFSTVGLPGSKPGGLANRLEPRRTVMSLTLSFHSIKTQKRLAVWPLMGLRSLLVA
jgi:hypothetical protein